MAVLHDEPKASSVALSCRHVDYYKSPTEHEATSGQSLAFAINSLLTLPLWGWALSLYWGWFIAPVTGLQQINLWQGAGIGFFFALLRYKLGTRHITAMELGYRALEDWVAPVFMIVIGWLFARLATGTA